MQKLAPLKIGGYVFCYILHKKHNKCNMQLNVLCAFSFSAMNFFSKRI